MEETKTHIEAPQSRRSPALAALLSVLVPGLGQWYAGARERGWILFGAVATLGVLLFWLHLPWLYLSLIPVWLWNAWDAWQLTQGRRASITVGVLLVALSVYAIGWRVTEIDLGKLALGVPKIRPVVRSLLHPDVLTRDVEVMDTVVGIQVPCAETPPPVATPQPDKPYLVVEPTCGEIGDVVTLRGFNLPPSTKGEIWWENPIGQEQHLRQRGAFVNFETDAHGQFTLQIVIPEAVPRSFRTGAQMHHVIARISHEVGAPHPSKTFWLVVQRMGETIAQALMATTLGILIAIPLSFLGARNLMAVNPIGTAVYYVARTVFNILRSIEPLIMAIVFVVWVGLGPFAGVLALVVHSVAALAKLYSEAIESIDPGPIEAITATGANRLQVIVYAVIPQVLPPFVAFSVYRWDINVRMSTIIGFVGGGGIGFLLQQWIRLSQYNAAGTAIWAIAVVVSVLDYLSAQVRERIV